VDKYSGTIELGIKVHTFFESHKFSYKTGVSATNFKPNYFPYIGSGWDTVNFFS